MLSKTKTNVMQNEHIKAEEFGSAPWSVLPGVEARREVLVESLSPLGNRLIVGPRASGKTSLLRGLLEASKAHPGTQVVINASHYGEEAKLRMVYQELVSRENGDGKDYPITVFVDDGSLILDHHSAVERLTRLAERGPKHGIHVVIATEPDERFDSIRAVSRVTTMRARGRTRADYSLAVA